MSKKNILYLILLSLLLMIIITVSINWLKNPFVGVLTGVMVIVLSNPLFKKFNTDKNNNKDK